MLDSPYEQGLVAVSHLRSRTATTAWSGVQSRPAFRHSRYRVFHTREPLNPPAFSALTVRRASSSVPDVNAIFSSSEGISKEEVELGPMNTWRRDQLSAAGKRHQLPCLGRGAMRLDADTEHRIRPKHDRCYLGNESGAPSAVQIVILPPESPAAINRPLG